MDTAQLHAGFMIAIPGLVNLVQQAVNGGNNNARVLSCGIELEAGRPLVLRIALAKWIGPDKHRYTTGGRALLARLFGRTTAEFGQRRSQFSWRSVDTFAQDPF